MQSQMTREKEIYRITLWGSIVNIVLTGLKFAAGILGASAAMIADAVHSLSDLLTDFVVLLFVKISSRPADSDHPYGHGKYETLATTIVAIALLAAGGVLLAQGIEKIIGAVRGETLPVPGRIALWAALISIAAKEGIYQLTARVGRRVQSSALEANAWHHRTDALSSVATAIGIGGALLFGGKWAILDPIAAVLVSVFILIAAGKLLHEAIQDLMEKRLPEEIEEEIREIVAADSEMSEMHKLRTRRVGNVYSIEMHLRMHGNISLYEAHRHSMLLEQRLRERFGQETLVSIHLEPLKVNGEYVPN
ncbi:MAG: cation transporter [Paludibacteraceae bacterium]|nr:cation transporter [Paludibacteraceae bacterium]